jgi:hypothetical protein
MESTEDYEPDDVIGKESQIQELLCLRRAAANEEPKLLDGLFQCKFLEKAELVLDYALLGAAAALRGQLVFLAISSFHGDDSSP